MLLRALLALLVFAAPARADLATADARTSSCVAALTAARDWAATRDSLLAKLAVTVDPRGVVVRGAECNALEIRVWRDARAHEQGGWRQEGPVRREPSGEADLCGERHVMTHAGMDRSASIATRTVEPAVVERFKAAVDVCLRTPEARAHDEAWHAACASQLRVARDQLAARDPFFRDAKLDEKYLQVHLAADGEAYSVNVIPMPLNDWADNRGWSVGGWDDCFGTCEARVWHRRTATLLALGAHASAFAAVLRPAAERCQALP